MTTLWMQTYTGKQFSFDHLSADDICIEDIAHHLSNLCRFNGATKRFYSVAEHSCYVSHYCPREYELWGLLDDAAEAYLGDRIRPLKWILEKYELDDIHSWLEKQITDLIITKFRLTPKERPLEVKEVDDRILLDERDQLMATPPADWDLKYALPLGVRLECWTPEVAERMFLHRFRMLKDRA